ncbi:MAG: hypothetical protein JWN99_823, partial [Ilumatobacteraceae bacterium]|nr:hypothetical protein [Ilumatobacteraceae bacterium]
MKEDAADVDGSAAPSIRRAIAFDYRRSTWGRRIALLAVALWLVYEWGPGNETVTPWLLVNIIGHNDGAIAIPLTALVGFAFTTSQQLASGVTALAGFSMFERTADAAWQRLHGVSPTAPLEWSRLGWGTRALMVFGLGTTAVALTQIMSTGHVGVRRHLRVIGQSALLCGTLVGLTGGVVATLAVLGRGSDRMSGATEWLLDVLGSPLLWLGLVLVGGLLHLLRRWMARATAHQS